MKFNNREEGQRMAALENSVAMLEHPLEHMDKRIYDLPDTFATHRAERCSPRA